MKLSNNMTIHEVNMKSIVKNIINADSINEFYKYFPKENRYLFLDIETTGLGHKNKIMLIGLVTIKSNDTLEVMQLFDDNGHSEYEILISLIDIIEKNTIDYFISFNGNAFDFPFINARLKHHNIDYSLIKTLNIDLLKIARAYKSQLGIEPLNLKSIENHLGIPRKDTISGKESITQYFNYLKTKDIDLESTILRHNYDDIINMLPLVRLLEYATDISKLIPRKIFTFNRQIWYLTSLSVKNKLLKIVLESHKADQMVPLRIIEDEIDIRKSSQSIQFELCIHHLSNEQQDIILLSPTLVFGKSFHHLEHNQQQSLVISIDSNWQMESLSLHLIRFFERYVF